MKLRVKSTIKVMTLFLVFTVCVILINTISAQQAVYKIGQKGPAGGWIFYDKQNYDGGWRYLEAAPQDQGMAKWGCAETSIPGAKGTAIGTGKINTEAIINSCQEPDIAAKIAVNYRGGGKNDWFLPSIDELSLMYTNLHKARIGGFNISHVYWSSSEAMFANTAWIQLFDKDVRDYSDKQYAKKVRAIRAF